VDADNDNAPLHLAIASEPSFALGAEIDEHARQKWTTLIAVNTSVHLKNLFDEQRTRVQKKTSVGRITAGRELAIVCPGAIS